MMLPSIFGEDLFDEMMDFPFEDDFFGKRNPLYGKKAKNMMKTDVKEHETGYEVDGYLTISASKGLDKDEEDKKGKYIRKERYAGSMSRSFYVGDGITEDDIKAKYENGILKLSIPKKEAKAVEQKKHIAIEG